VSFWKRFTSLILTTCRDVDSFTRPCVQGGLKCVQFVERQFREPRSASLFSLSLQISVRCLPLTDILPPYTTLCYYFDPLPAGVRSIAISVSVCLSVFLFARMSQKPHVQTSQNLLRVAVARSFSDDSAVRYVLPVLWTTAEGCQSAGGNAERGGAEAHQLRLSMRCLPLTDILPPYTTDCGGQQSVAHGGRSLLSSIVFTLNYK